jgi:hypothetical protein
MLFCILCTNFTNSTNASVQKSRYLKSINFNLKQSVAPPSVAMHLS